MAKFKVGQKARFVKVYTYPEMMGKETTIKRVIGEYRWNGITDIAYEHTGVNGLCFEHQLERVVDKRDFKRFMRRVLKPVDIREPVTA